MPPAALAQIKTPDQVLSHAGRQTRIDPREIPPGRMLMIVSWIKARKVHVAKLGAAAKAAPDCIAGPAPQALRFAWAVAHGCHVGEVKARPNVAIARRPGGAWTVTRKPGGGVTIDMRPVHSKSGAPTGNSGPFTGNSGAPTGNSGPITGNGGAPAGNSGTRDRRPESEADQGWPRDAPSRPGSRSRPEPGNSGNSGTQHDDHHQVAPSVGFGT